MKAQSYKVVEYLQKNNDSTAMEVAAATGLSKRMVDAIFSSAVVAGGFGERVAKESGYVLRLNRAGLSYKNVE